MLREHALPLPAIRAFVAAGRHGSFTRAGASLGLTQSAISRHIALLERHLGTLLFVRRGPQASLTVAGTQYFDAVKDAMATLELATLHARRDTSSSATNLGSAQRLLVRTSTPSLALTVLVPALAQLKAQHGIELDIISSLAAPLPGDRFDVLITRDLALSAAEQWQLAREQVLCVCAPGLHARLMAERRLSWPFIVASSRPDVMSAWAPAIGLEAAQIERVASYDHYFLAIAAALGGLGLLVAPRLLVQRHIADGTLVAVPHSAHWTGASYCAYAHPKSEKAALSAAFSRWFKAHLRELIEAV